MERRYTARWNPEWNVAKAKLMGEEKDPKLYHEFITYISKVLDAYSTDEYKICGMLWVQGESDSKIPDAEKSYGSTLRKLIRQVREDLGQNNLPFLLFQVGSKQVADGMKRCADKTNNVTLIIQNQSPDSPDYYDKMKNGHYNYKGMKKLGTRFADAYLSSYSDK